MRRWPRERFELVARIDTASGDRATLFLRDGTREWPIGVVRGPVRRVFWLDSPAIAREGRRALTRAFDDASMYSEETRIVEVPRLRGPSTAGRTLARGAPTKAARRASRLHRAA
jgi:hypothetical protein